MPSRVARWRNQVIYLGSRLSAALCPSPAARFEFNSRWSLVCLNCSHMSVCQFDVHHDLRVRGKKVSHDWPHLKLRRQMKRWVRSQCCTCAASRCSGCLQLAFDVTWPLKVARAPMILRPGANSAVPPHPVTVPGPHPYCPRICRPSCHDKQRLPLQLC